MNDLRPDIGLIPLIRLTGVNMTVSGMHIDESISARQSTADELIDLWLQLLELSIQDRVRPEGDSDQLRRFSTAISKPDVIERVIKTAAKCEVGAPVTEPRGDRSSSVQDDRRPADILSSVVG
jgi:hypothetical protein